MTGMHITEAQWQATVTDLAAVHGWTRAHFRAARTAAGSHVTPVQYEGKGFPDLVLVRDRVIFAELKGTRGRLAPDQRMWIDALTAAGQEVYVWWPRHFDEVAEVLATRTDTGATR